MVFFCIAGIHEHNSVAIGSSEALKPPRFIGILLGSRRPDRTISWRGIWSQLLACVVLGLELNDIGILPKEVLVPWQVFFSLAMVAVIIVIIYRYWRDR
jgi:hypothetical protein